MFEYFKYIGKFDFLVSLMPFLIAGLAIKHDHFDKRKNGLKKISSTGWKMILFSSILFLASLALANESTKEQIEKHKTMVEKIENIISELKTAQKEVKNLNTDIKEAQGNFSSLFCDEIKKSENNIKIEIWKNENRLSQAINNSKNNLSSWFSLTQVINRPGEVENTQIEENKENISLPINNFSPLFRKHRQLETAKLLVNFSSGNVSLSNDDKKKISKFIKTFSSNPNVHFQINGYASHTGSLKKNFKYAKTRRNSVYEYLTETLNINGDKIDKDKIDDVNAWVTDNQKVELIVLLNSK